MPTKGKTNIQTAVYLAIKCGLVERSIKISNHYLEKVKLMSTGNTK